MAERNLVRGSIERTRGLFNVLRNPSSHVNVPTKPPKTGRRVAVAGIGAGLLLLATGQSRLAVAQEENPVVTTAADDAPPPPGVGVAEGTDGPPPQNQALTAESKAAGAPEGSAAAGSPTERPQAAEVPGDDAFKTAIEARIPYVQKPIFEGTAANPYPGKFTQDEINKAKEENKQPESASESLGFNLYQKMNAQCRELGGRAAEAAIFLENSTKVPVNGLPTTDVRLSPSFSLRSPSLEALISMDQFRFSLEEPIKAYFKLQPDQSEKRPNSQANLVMVAVINGDGQFKDLSVNDARLSFYAMVLHQEVKLTQQLATQRMKSMNPSLPPAERQDAIQQIDEQIRSSQSLNDIGAQAIMYALDGIDQALATGKNLYIDPELRNMLDVYRQVKANR